ncbi:hypothetical protein DYH09_02035 [bacterium CPR1]|nr:hypothetical protein [bacterium CPR1]
MMNGTVINLNQFQRACNVIKVIDSMRSHVLSLDNIDGVDVDGRFSERHRENHVASDGFSGPLIRREFINLPSWDNHVELEGFNGLTGWATNQPGIDDFMCVARQGSGSTPTVEYKLDNNKPDAPVYVLRIGDAEQAVYVNRAQGTLTLPDLVSQIGGGGERPAARR